MTYYSEKIMTYEGKSLNEFINLFTEEEIEEMREVLVDQCDVVHDPEDKEAIVMDIVSNWISDNVKQRCTNAETAQLFNVYMNIM